MRSRNRLLNGPVGELVVEEPEEGGFLYNKETGNQRHFDTTNQITQALESREWVKIPKETDHPEVKFPNFKPVGIKAEDYKPPEKPYENPTKKHYLRTMNKSELMAEGLEVGLVLSDGDFTNREMIALIEAKRKEVV
uniref:Uncharacterized protein n=1 Tax=viral metagenome TaxID=1070528 RepID=A0A6M3IL44_9ZZZZ